MGLLYLLLTTEGLNSDKDEDVAVLDAISGLMVQAACV
jgi:hypothetical protein